MKKIFAILAITLACVSCNKWLDINPRTEARSEDLFSTEDGYKDALTACYIKMNDRSLYGEYMNMTVMECFAHLWTTSQSGTPLCYLATNFRFEDLQLRNAVNSMYYGLYNVIVQANTLIAREEESKEVLNSKLHSVIMGEAYALRAFCHFDVLRMFGQMPQNPTREVSLPYSTKVSKDAPAYYDYNSFLGKIMADIEKADSYLKDAEALNYYTQFESNYGNAHSGHAISFDEPYAERYRKFRFNYYAVQALKARIYTYTGDKAKAYAAAKSVIEAQGPDGNPIVELATDSDYVNNRFALPTECVFALSNFQLADYTVALLNGVSGAQVRSDQLYISLTNLNTLFNNVTSNNRYNYGWERSTTNAYGRQMPTIRKYYQVEKSAGMITTEVVPIFRLSEMYLIVMESTDNLAEAQALYNTYMRAHSVSDATQFETKDQLDAEIINEYRREFFAEGQMFFTYKRTGATKMLWRNQEVGEDQYILPLPDSEYDPGKVKSEN